MNSHQFSGGVIQKYNDFILRITFDVENDLSVKHIKEVKAFRQSMFGDNYYCTLIDARKELMGISHEAKVHIATNPSINKWRISEAILVNNFGKKLGVELYIRIFKPKSATKVFYKEDEAIKWLKKEFDKFNSSLK